MTLAVTGVTGHLGRFAVEHLLSRGVPASQIVGLARRPEAAGEIASRGVAVRSFDYNNPDPAALAGVTSLLLVSGTEFGRRAAQHQAVIEAAKQAGVSRIVYTSAPDADTSINPVAPEHKATEEALAASGLGVVVLRNGWYHENFLRDLEAAAQTGELLTATGAGRVSSASRSEYAEAAAVVLAGDEVGRTYTLGGDVAWTYDDLAADLAEVLGRPVSVRQVSADEKLAALTSFGVDPGMAGFGVGVDVAIAAGELEITTGDLSRLIGHPTSPVIETLRAAK